jgi:protoporphyrinogen IX oxidase
MSYLLIKALHVVFMVSYFAGIFYLVRLFVYYKDAENFATTKKEILQEQYLFMANRLWKIITLPAGVLMLLCGITMLVINPDLLSSAWFQVKIVGLLALGIYHFWCWKTLAKMNQTALHAGNLKLRQANEIATFILFLVVFSVILKQDLISHGWQLALWFVGLVLGIRTLVKWVNKKK